jgi:hypothetical protein
MTKKFVIMLIISLVVGAALAQLWQVAPAVYIFVVSTLGAQVYFQSFDNRKKLRIEISPKKLSKFADQMKQFKK